MNRLTRLATGFALVATLAACGNGQSDVGKMLKAIPAALTSKKAEPVTVSAEQIANSLVATPKPIKLIIWEGRQAQFLMVELERNGPHHSFGTSSRQMIVFRNGMITSTRGLGGDLMSSEEDALLSIVRHRQGGTAPYALRFLTPEDLTETRQYSCTVTRGATVPVQSALVKTTGVTMTAQCAGDRGSFTNTYVVDGQGTILSTRQWLGDTIGYITAQALRL